MGKPDADGPTLVEEVVLVVGQDALMHRSRHQFGEAAYHVRVFQPVGSAVPVAVIGDMGNHFAASATNRFDEIALIVATQILGRPDVGFERLEEVARWIGYGPAGQHIPSAHERYTEKSFNTLPGLPLADVRSRHLERHQAEEIAGGSLRFWHADDYTLRNLKQSGTRVLQVGETTADEAGGRRRRRWFSRR